MPTNPAHPTFHLTDHHTGPVPPLRPPVGQTAPPSPPVEEFGWASFGGRVATHAVECIDILTAPERLTTGTWFVVATFEGNARAWRFTHTDHTVAHSTGTWLGPSRDAWTTSMDQVTYTDAVKQVHAHIRDGDVYQANICRVLSAPLNGPFANSPITRGPHPSTWRAFHTEPSARALASRLAAGNPAPHAAAIHIPAATGLPPVWVVSASPELYLSLEAGAHGKGTIVKSHPIKGTARTPSGLTPKDCAENVMITDLVRNDLQRVCRPGTVKVTSLLTVEKHPGLAHLVSRVEGTLSHNIAQSSALWRHLFTATFPPGSVSGAPKHRALHIIRELEPVERGPYCGAVGWVVDGLASLAVGIRTFWWEHKGNGGILHFGTGAGITWDSDPLAEWHETELKAELLVALASS